MVLEYRGKQGNPIGTVNVNGETCSVARVGDPCRSSEYPVTRNWWAPRVTGIRVNPTDQCFHFGYQPRITQGALKSTYRKVKTGHSFYWMLLGDAGCKIRRIENPRVSRVPSSDSGPQATRWFSDFP